MIYEAVDHDTFKPGNREDARAHVASFGITRAVRIVRVFRLALQELRRPSPGMEAGAATNLRGVSWSSWAHFVTRNTRPSCTHWFPSSASPKDVVFTGPVPLEETALFYRAADLLVYPSLNETFGLPILEAMACACPVVTSDVSAMPETAGGAAVLADPA